MVDELGLSYVGMYPTRQKMCLLHTPHSQRKKLLSRSMLLLDGVSHRVGGMKPERGRSSGEQPWMKRTLADFEKMVLREPPRLLASTVLSGYSHFLYWCGRRWARMATRQHQPRPKINHTQSANQTLTTKPSTYHLTTNHHSPIIRQPGNQPTEQLQTFLFVFLNS